MRALLLSAFLFLPQNLVAETLGEEMARAGFTATEARLAALPAPKPDELFALGGVRFLGAVEAALQLRWRYGLTDTNGMMPFLRVPIAENPNPLPYDPALISTLFSDVLARMAAANAALAGIPEGADFGMDVDLSKLWFDINANGQKDVGEGMFDVLGFMLMDITPDPSQSMPPLMVRFDAADAPWLSAYTHLLSGLSDMVLAYDPTEPISRIIAARQSMRAMGAIAPDYFFGSFGDPADLDSMDYLAIVIATLGQTPKAGHMPAARDHFLAMIAENRRFWAAVDKETDNQNEWLPNDRQKSALGIDLPPGTGAAWLAMLGDLEKILNGELLLPYWRFEGGTPAGINLATFFTDARPIDVAGWAQGWGALPYLEKGPLVTDQTSAALDALMMGNPMLLTLYLN